MFLIGQYFGQYFHCFFRVCRYTGCTMPMNAKIVISREDAKAELESRATLLEEKLRESFDWVQAILNQDAARRLTLDLSIQAAMVYQRFVELLEAAMVGDPSVRITKVGRMRMFSFGQKLRLRFKKLDRNLTAKNVRTKHQHGMYHQLLLPGLDNDMTDVTFGYLTNKTGQKIDGIYLTCPKNWKENHWRIEFEDPMMGHGLFVTPPVAPIKPQEVTPLVRPKTASRKAKEA